MPDDLRQVYDRLADTYEQNRGLFDMSEVIDDFYRSLPVPRHRRGNVFVGDHCQALKKKSVTAF
jgi:hypothetical protein